MLKKGIKSIARPAAYSDRLARKIKGCGYNP
jgi:hypothetical protein